MYVSLTYLVIENLPVNVKLYYWDFYKYFFLLTWSTTEF